MCPTHCPDSASAVMSGTASSGSGEETLMVVAVLVATAMMVMAFRLSRALLGIIRLWLWRVLFGKSEERPGIESLESQCIRRGCLPMYAAGFCKKCRVATQCAWHCHACGTSENSEDGNAGHGGRRIVVHHFKDGTDAYICTRCHFVPRLSWHCDGCGGGKTIIALQKS